MIKIIKRFFKNMNMSDYDRYLAKSVDLVDLERRQKELDTRFTRKL